MDRIDAITLFLALIFTATSGQAQEAYQVIEVNNGGTITGRVYFPEVRPELEPIRITKDNDVCGIRKESEMFVISESGGLKNVVITLKGIHRGKAPQPVSRVTLTQKGCVYLPHIQVATIAPKGVDVEVVNEDGILHNIHAYAGTETLFNVAQPVFRKKLTKHLDSPGVVTFKCDVHGWMNAYMVLTTSPYTTMTDEEGNYTLRDVPPGTYMVEAWHEAMGTLEKSVTVSGGQEARVNFDIVPTE